MTADQIEVVTQECQAARAQADLARDLAMRLRHVRARMDVRGLGPAWSSESLTCDVRVLGEAIAFLSALGGQP